MVALLDDRHSRYLSPQEAFQEQARTSGTDVRVGIGIAVDGDRIETVYGNSPAEEAGLRRRDQILTVDGRPFLDAPAALRGEAGTSVTIEVQAPGAEPRTLTVERRPVVQKIRPEAYRLPGTNIGYLLIQSFWADDMGEQVVAALNDLLATGDLDGLIVDLRGNGGGWRPVLEALLGTFVSGPVGEFYRQDQGRPLEARPNELQPRLATTPMVILVDQGSQSYAEVLPAALQAAGRAKIVGGRTAGNTETIFAHDFDDASRLWLAGEGFRLPSGANLEGSGVIPDVEIEADWLTFAEMDDPYIKKALELLHATGE
jgi:carboxyl-terminal processing protease